MTKGKQGDIDPRVEQLADLAVRARKVLDAVAAANRKGPTIPDPNMVLRVLTETWQALTADPDRWAQAQKALYDGYMPVVAAMSHRAKGEPADAVVAPDAGDRRFADPAWTRDPYFDFIKQSYLHFTGWLRDQVRQAPGLDPRTRLKADFYIRQYLNMLAPTNFVMTNPAVLKKTLETEGANLLDGMANLLGDLERGHGELRISMTDPDAFAPGRNIATTPGKVVWRTELAELIQYTPTTKTVRRRPLLIVPPWINKYYVLDLRPENSFIRWAVERGHTVFILSWVNPGADLSGKRFDDYMLDGPLAALDVIERITGEPQVNMVGYCIGGTLTAATLAHLAAKGQGGRVASATFLTTLVDFREPGDLGVFIDEEQIGLLDQHMAQVGYLDGSRMAQVFSMLRENDLVWSFVIGNYLMGRKPPPFDLLYWNSDATRMPAMMHGQYLRDMYPNNRLVEPGALTLAGTPIDLGAITQPVYILSTREDHIAPWRSTYAATQVYGGPVTFVLSGSGHIAGVINPPAKAKYGHWVNRHTPADPQAWLAGAQARDGSWWDHWDRWVARHGGGRVPPRQPGAGPLPALDDAPGRYVKVRI